MPIGTETLIERAVRVASQSKQMTNLIFSTDDEVYANLALKSGAYRVVKRPHKLSDDFASSWDVVRHAVEKFENDSSKPVDMVALLQPTTPFRTIQHIDKAIEKIAKDKFEAAMTIREISYPVEWMFWLDDEQNAQHVVYRQEHLTRRQDAKPTFQPAGTVYAVTRERLFSDEPMKHENIAYIKVPIKEAINIDTMEDYLLAKALFDEGMQ